MNPNFDTYRTRIMAMQEACIAGSTALQHTISGDNPTPLWLNNISVLSLKEQGSHLFRWTLQCKSLLIYHYIKEGYNQGADAHVQAQNDIPTVLSYFLTNKNMVVGVYTSPPDSYVIDSLVITSDPDGITPWEKPGGKVYGVEYTLIWQHTNNNPLY